MPLGCSSVLVLYQPHFEAWTFSSGHCSSSSDSGPESGLPSYWPIVIAEFPAFGWKSLLPMGGPQFLSPFFRSSSLFILARCRWCHLRFVFRLLDFLRFRCLGFLFRVMWVFLPLPVISSWFCMYLFAVVKILKSNPVYGVDSWCIKVMSALLRARDSRCLMWIQAALLRIS